MKFELIITCEHAGNSVPTRYSHHFQKMEEILQSHRGWDLGAIEIADFLSNKLKSPLFSCDTTRLLVEPNRSLDSSALFSEYSSAMTQEEREEALQLYYYKHRQSVEALIRGSLKKVLHLSVHTFTPVWNGATRTVDVGLLFDPSRRSESSFCERYLLELKQRLPAMNIEFNEPYKGIDDGFTTYLRTVFEDESYLGIELEINQKYYGTAEWHTLSTALYEGLKQILE